MQTIQNNMLEVENTKSGKTVKKTMSDPAETNEAS